MSKMVTLSIDGRSVTVPENTLVVDAAKMNGIDIPVFCYHPKMKPVGMCRMCLVEIGRPMIDRATNQPVLEDNGSPKIQFSPKLETSCTTPVSEGMVVLTRNDKVEAARKEIIEFILTSHPLDCPICDKGGECPLQNLTMRFGSKEGRFLFDEKMHLAKHVPLGELIWLDRERCIQCARCVRFQHDVVDDPVLDFHNRGRSLEIMTFSEPGFGSYFSGNTTDICPVGALTTADFRFGARPWEMKPAASLCAQCPVGCNLEYTVRREAKSGGATVIKRALPRQNESVNEIWICDKGRFGYHYTQDPARLGQPLVRRDGELVPVTFEEALKIIAEKAAHQPFQILAGGKLSTEDLAALRGLAQESGGKAWLHTYMSGGFTPHYGLSADANLGALGQGDAVLVAASDLHEEAPIWWLRVKQAAERGAALIVMNPRPTRLKKYARHVIRYAYGEESLAVAAMAEENLALAGEEIRAAAETLKSARNLVIFYGSEGLGLTGSKGLEQALADLLERGGFTGRENSGLIGVWHAPNLQAGFELGLPPAEGLADLPAGGVLYLAAADPAGDDPRQAAYFSGREFVIVQDLFLTESAKLADVVLPVLAYTEREGTFVSGERRLQRYYPALAARPGLKADFALTALIAKSLGYELEGRAASLALEKLAASQPAFEGLNYLKLAEVHEQWPQVGGSDLYYGGTSYANRQGLGKHLSRAAKPEPDAAPLREGIRDVPKNALRLVPHTRLYDAGSTFAPSRLLDQRRARRQLRIHPRSAEPLGLQQGSQALIELEGAPFTAEIVLDETIPGGTALYPRSLGVPMNAPFHAVVKPVFDKSAS